MIPSTPTGSSDPAPSWSGPGGIVQVVDLHAAEHSWEVSPGAAVHGYGFNGQVPGPRDRGRGGGSAAGPVQQRHGPAQHPGVGAIVGAATPLSTSAPTGFSLGKASSSSTLSPSRAPSCTRRPRRRTRRACWTACTGRCWSQVRVNLVVDEERIFVVHHVELTAAHRDETQHAAPVIGRPGPPLLLINGVRHTWIDMRAGSRERWRILNAATDVQLRLSLPARPARIAGRHVPPPKPLDLPVPQATTRAAAGLDVQIGPFAQGQQVTLDAVLAGDGPARQHRSSSPAKSSESSARPPPQRPLHPRRGRPGRVPGRSRLTERGQRSISEWTDA